MNITFKQRWNYNGAEYAPNQTYNVQSTVAAAAISSGVAFIPAKEWIDQSFTDTEKAAARGAIGASHSSESMGVVALTSISEIAALSSALYPLGSLVMVDLPDDAVALPWKRRLLAAEEVAIEGVLVVSTDNPAHCWVKRG